MCNLIFPLCLLGAKSPDLTASVVSFPAVGLLTVAHDLIKVDLVYIFSLLFPGPAEATRRPSVSGAAPIPQPLAQCAPYQCGATAA